MNSTSNTWISLENTKAFIGAYHIVLCFSMDIVIVVKRWI